jgi:hypothetical protein
VLVDLTSGAAEVREVDDLRRLHVLGPASLDVDRALRAAGLGSQDPDGRVLLDVAALRDAAESLTSDPAWPQGWEAMVAFARSKGWVASGGSALVAHVERTP